MGQDKALLDHNGKSQLQYAYDLLMPFCAKVFISVRADQSKQQGYGHLPQIHDLPQFSGIGPLGGILSAMAAYPDAAWLLLACDLPLVTPQTIRYLIEHRDPQKTATAFISSSDRLPEPLCAIWEAGSRSKALQLLSEGVQCPRKVLIRSDVRLIEQQDPCWLENVNAP